MTYGTLCVEYEDFSCKKKKKKKKEGEVKEKRKRGMTQC